MKDKIKNPLKPWLNEPNSLIWQDKRTGLTCEIHRHPTMGHLCGYVNINTHQPLFKEQPSYIDLKVHGGISFSGYLDNSYKDSYKIGFDCAHYNDISPYHITNLKGECAIYRTIKYVKEQCKKLAKQIWNYKE